MTTSQTPFLSETISAPRLGEPTLAYFRSRFRHRVHAFLLTEFLKREREGLTKADLARRLAKKPEQITRWLSAPANYELDTISDLLLGMGSELLFAASSLQRGAVQPTKEAWNLPRGHFDMRENEYRLPDIPHPANDFVNPAPLAQDAGAPPRGSMHAASQGPNIRIAAQGGQR